MKFLDAILQNEEPLADSQDRFGVLVLQIDERHQDHDRQQDEQPRSTNGNANKTIIHRSTCLIRSEDAVKKPRFDSRIVATERNSASDVSLKMEEILDGAESDRSVVRRGAAATFLPSPQKRRGERDIRCTNL